MQEIGDRYRKNFFLEIYHDFRKEVFLCSICQFFHSFFGGFVELKKLS